KTMDDMKEAAVKIHELGAKNVVIKGGKVFDHEKAIDLFYDGKAFTVLENEKINTTYNHGAGCTFAAATTANLANGKSVKEAVANAKEFVIGFTPLSFLYHYIINCLYSANLYLHFVFLQS